VDAHIQGQLMRSLAEREQLAKEWLVRIVERTPLLDVGELPLQWLVAEAPRMIADILGTVAEPGAAAEPELADEERELTKQLASLRLGEDAPEQIPRDLAALQEVLIESLRREVPERRPADFTNAVTRLAEAFGAIQGGVTKVLVEERSGGAARDRLTGLPGRVQLDEWMGILLAEHRRYGHPFALALIDIDGLAKINQSRGRVAGDRMVAAVAEVVRRQVREADQAFRLDEDEFAIIAPHTEAGGLVRMASRVAELIEAAQVPEGPRIAITVGVAACPEDGMSAERLLQSVDEASYTAKAEGVPVARRNGAPIDLQDR
jgi:diguanylate cyclase (GGDEF)-like protein